MVTVGDKIKIIEMQGEPQYTGKEGIVKRICTDPWGDEFWVGTWGGLTFYPKVDKYELVYKNDFSHPFDENGNYITER